MSIPDPTYAVPPVRSGADPQLDVVAAGLTAGPTLQPAWPQITSKLVGWIRWHFGDADRIEYPNLTSRIWTGNVETSTIFISSLAEWNPKKSGERPSILVDRLDQELDMSKYGVGGGRLMGTLPDTSYYSYCQGAHVVHCLGGREGEADFLAAEVWREFRRYARVAADAMCLVRFLPVKVDRRQQLQGEHKEHYATSIPVLYYYADSWNVYPTDETEIRTVILGS